MANRHLARSVVLQTLFELDFHGFSDEVDVDASLNRNCEEFAPGSNDMAFMRDRVDGVRRKRPDLDAIIEKAAPEWPIDKIASVDRNILRLGLYELLFADRSEVPAKVAINEAIELAKTFGGEKSSKFVNGVLGAVYKEIGEPGKEETGGKKKSAGKQKPQQKQTDDVPYEQLPQKHLTGAVVFARNEGDTYLALVHDIFGHWTLSKGRVGEDESLTDGVQRVVSDEMGLSKTEVHTQLGDNEYVANHPEQGKMRKRVVYYLLEAPFQELQLEQGGGLDDAQWFKLADVIDLNFYEDIMPIVTTAINELLKQDSSDRSGEQTGTA